MKRIIVLLIFAVLFLCACGSKAQKEPEATTKSEDQILLEELSSRIAELESQLDAETATSKVSRSSPTYQQQSSSSQPRTTQASYDYDYVANKNTKKFHEPDCASVGDMKESNKWYYTGDRQELIDMGYDPCGRCHP